MSTTLEDLFRQVLGDKSSAFAAHSNDGGASHSNDGAAVDSYGATGGAVAPAASGPAQAATSASADSPIQQALAKLMQGSQAYAQAHRGFQGNHLEGGRAGAQLVTSPQSMAPAGSSPITQLLGQVAKVNQRQGSADLGNAFQEYKLNDGRVAHVYYDENGKRRVKVFMPGTAPAAATTLPAAA